MSSRDATDALSFTSATDAAIILHVLADHDSLRRSLTALLESWGARTLAFKTACGLLGHWRHAGRRPSSTVPQGTIVDTHGLDTSLATLLHDLAALGDAGPLLVLHSSNSRLRRDLEAIDRARVVDLIKPYRVGALFRTVQGLIEDRGQA